MKVNRINVMIKRAENKHISFLYNDINQLMNNFKFGGVFHNDRVELHSAPETVTKVLDKLKIVFERLK